MKRRLQVLSLVLLPFALAAIRTSAAGPALAPLSGSPHFERDTWSLDDGDALSISDSVGLGRRLTFDVITDRPGKQPWDQLRILFDYHDKDNQTVLTWTTYGSIGITAVRNGQRQSLYKAEGRGKPNDWHHVLLDITPEGIVVTLDLRHETLVPWADPANPGRLAFACEGGAAGRVVPRSDETLNPRADGALGLAPLFSDHAVLPHGIDVPVWGTSEPGTSVEVRLDEQPALTVTADAQGNWSAALPAQKPGGPHTLRIRSGAHTLSRNDLLFGEVWFCSGQSNMVWRLKQADNADAEAAAGDHYPRLRVFPVQTDSTDTECDTPPTPSEWYVSSLSTCRHVSAVAQFFGRDLTTSLDMPVGVIVSAIGGTRIESWLSAPARDRIEQQSGPYDQAYRDSIASNTYGGPGVYFNAMVAPYTRLPVTGFLWYQGESNGWRAWHYRHLLAGLIEDWRSRFPRAQEPFLVVQLPRYALTGKMEPTGVEWAELRAVQADVAVSTPDTYVAVTIDTGPFGEIHPTTKRPVGDRLSRLALAKVYGRQDIVAEAPRLVSAKPIPGGLRLTFDRAVELRDNPAQDLLVATDDGPFQAPASVRQTAMNRLEVLAAPPLQPTQVRYAWKNFPKATLFDPEGLPVAPFRTDSRPLKSTNLY
ncbi:MAG TPA: sialate O-acetylesterase [Opitutaceae bacterium]